VNAAAGRPARRAVADPLALAVLQLRREARRARSRSAPPLDSRDARLIYPPEETKEVRTATIT
jgi:hypothetical protein